MATGLFAMRDNLRLRLEQEKLSRLQELQQQRNVAAPPVSAPDHPVASVRELFAARRAGSGTSVGRRISSGGGQSSAGLRRDLPNTPPLIPPIGITNDRYADVDLPSSASTRGGVVRGGAGGAPKAPASVPRQAATQPPRQVVPRPPQAVPLPAAPSPRPPRAPRPVPQRTSSADSRRNDADAEAMPDMAAVRRARASRITEESKRRLSTDGERPPVATRPAPRGAASSKNASLPTEDPAPEEDPQQRAERAAKAEAARKRKQEILERTTRAEERSRQLKERQEARKITETARKASGGMEGDEGTGGWEDQPVGSGAPHGGHSGDAASEESSHVALPRQPAPAAAAAAALKAAAPSKSKWDDDDDGGGGGGGGGDGGGGYKVAVKAKPASKPLASKAVARLPVELPEAELPLSPRGAYDLDALLAEAEPPGNDGDGSLTECDICNRRFAAERIDKHIAVCSKAANKKRKVFDPSKQRVIDAEMAKFVKDAKKVDAKYEKKLERTKGNWRYKHEEFIRALKAAKGADTSDLPPPPKDNPDYVRCDWCGRQFNETAAERHIPLCRDRAAKKPAAPAAKKK